jgi:hypothetical protein
MIYEICNLKDILKPIHEHYDYDYNLTEFNNILPLNCTWVIWIYNEQNVIHNQSESSWKSKITPIYEFNTVQGFWEYFSTFKYMKVNTMFLMRKGINPVWEDPCNIKGGSWSFIIPKPLGIETWIELACMVVGESVVQNNFIKVKNSYLINGISISIKFKSFVIKIWNSDKNISDSSIINEIKYIIPKNISYKHYFEDTNNHITNKVFKGNWD